MLVEATDAPMSFKLWLLPCLARSPSSTPPSDWPPLAADWSLRWLLWCERSLPPRRRGPPPPRRAAESGMLYVPGGCQSAPSLRRSRGGAHARVGGVCGETPTPSQAVPRPSASHTPKQRCVACCFAFSSGCAHCYRGLTVATAPATPARSGLPPPLAWRCQRKTVGGVARYRHPPVAAAGRLPAPAHHCAPGPPTKTHSAATQTCCGTAPRCTDSSACRSPPHTAGRRRRRRPLLRAVPLAGAWTRSSPHQSGSRLCAASSRSHPHLQGRRGGCCGPADVKMCGVQRTDG